MGRIACSLGLVCSLGLFIGCGQQTAAPAAAAPASASASTGGLAVIDLDQLATQLGRGIQVTEQVQQRQADLNKQLSKLQVTLREKLAEKQQTLGEELTDEQKAEFQNYQIQLNQQLVQARRQAEVNLEIFKQALINQFREQVKPVAQEIAQSKGFNVVIPRNDTLLLSIDPGVDITAAVAAKMQAMTPADSAPSQTAAAEAPGTTTE